MLLNKEQEYRRRRREDSSVTRKIEKFIDSIYADKGFAVERISDDKLQKKGVDIIHRDGDVTHYVDEKYAINYYNRDLKTYSFELYSANNVNCEGWFTSDYMITTHYMLLWFRSNDSYTKFYSYDLCYISKEKLKAYLYEKGFRESMTQEFINYWENDVHKNPNRSYYELGNRRYRVLSGGLKMVQSCQYQKEQPITIIVPKEDLIRLADIHYKK